jgi:hypothetical protein
VKHCYDIRKLTSSVGKKEELPQQGKESAVITIYMKGDKTDCNNCRGISLLPTSYEILSTIFSRVTLYVDEITGVCQYGL